MRARLTSLIFVGFFAACGSSGQKGDAGSGDAKDAPTGDAPAEKAGDAPASTDGGDASETAPSTDGRDGRDGGDGGDAAEAGPTCDPGCTGACVEGVCIADIVITQDTDLSTAMDFSARNCVAMPQYRVNSLSGTVPTVATLAESPGDGCLTAGDEVMLIDIQGSMTDVGRVGNWELLRVASVNLANVTFTTFVKRDYGVLAKDALDGGVGGAAGTGGASDAGMADAPATEAGASDGGGVGGAPPPLDFPQKVLLIRVPRFGNLKILAGAHVTARAWNGTAGGVIALRAAALTVEGEINAGTLGYRGGRWSEDGQGCANNITTEAGESVSGLGFATTGRNYGGAGGIGLRAGTSFSTSTPISPSPAHATPGEPGANAGGRALGDPGAVYGVPDGSRLTMGSGPGGNLTCSNETTLPRLLDEPGQAGGIVALFVDTLTVGTAGAISATPPEQSRDVAFAGGYVFIRGNKLDVGTARVTAKGSKARSGSPPTVNLINKAGDGYVVLDATGTITGTTDPAAHAVTH